MECTSQATGEHIHWLTSLEDDGSSLDYLRSLKMKISLIHRPGYICVCLESIVVMFDPLNFSIWSSRPCRSNTPFVPRGIRSLHVRVIQDRVDKILPWHSCCICFSFVCMEQQLVWWAYQVSSWGMLDSWDGVLHTACAICKTFRFCRFFFNVLTSTHNGTISVHPLHFIKLTFLSFLVFFGWC